MKESLLPRDNDLLLPSYKFAAAYLDNSITQFDSMGSAISHGRVDSVHPDTPHNLDNDMEQTRYPKRKRQEVSYVDNGENDFESLSDYDGEVEATSTKKQKVIAAKKNKPLPKRKVFPFMSLPPELRNQVYEMALSDPHGHYIVAERRANRRVGSRVPLNSFRITHPGRYEKYRRRQQIFAGLTEEEKEDGWRKNALRSVILRLNSTIYGEAIGYLYNAKFSFADTNALHDFLAAIGPRMRARLRNIEIAEWGYSLAHKAMNYPAMCMLADAVNLEQIWLNICHWEHTLSQKIFRDCSTFMINYGAANGKKDAALDILKLPSSEDEKKPWQVQKSIRSPATNKKALESVRAYVLAA